MTAYRPVLDYAVIGCKLKQNANEGRNSCGSLTGLVLCFIVYFILLVIAPLLGHCTHRCNSLVVEDQSCFFPRSIETVARSDATLQVRVRFNLSRIRQTSETCTLCRCRQQRSTEFRLRFLFRRRMWTGKQSQLIRYTFGFSVLQLVNSVVAESRVQSLSCGGRKCARRRESLASLCTD